MSLGLTQSLERAACGHLQLLYAFPRMMEVPLFKRVGFRPIGDVVRYVRVLQHAPFLGKRIPWILARLSGPALDAWARTRDALCNAGTRRLLGTWTDRVDPRMQRLWETSTKPDGIVGTRDAAYLSSRFDASTDDGFRFLLVTDPTTNDLLAWFAVRPMGRTLHVLDYWSSHGPAIGTRVLYMLLHCSSKTGYVAVSLDQSSLSPYLSPWRATGFVECSRRPVMGYWHTHALGQHLGEVHLTAGDSAY